MILTIKTDQPEAEIGLYTSEGEQVQAITWQAHRQLGETIHLKINDLLSQNNATYKDLGGIVFYSGPGSFTGLRIGASVAGALGTGLKISLVNSGGDKWKSEGIVRLQNGESESVNITYGSDPHITQPKK